MLEVDGVVAEHAGDEQAERARLRRADVGSVVAQADAQERPTGARTSAALVAEAGRRTRAAVAVGRATVVVAVAPQTQLKLARCADLQQAPTVSQTVMSN